MSQRVGIVRCAVELLERALEFPPGHRIVRVLPGEHPHQMDLVVEGNSLPEIGDQEPLPLLDAVVRVREVEVQFRPSTGIQA